MPITISTDIPGMLGVTDPAKIEDIRNTQREAVEGYKERNNADDIPRLQAQKKIRDLIKKLEAFDKAGSYGIATLNLFDENPEAREHDQRFRAHLDGLIEELYYKLRRWKPRAGSLLTREYAEGTPKSWLGAKAVELVAQYQPGKLSKTESGLACQIANKLYEIATGKRGEDPGVGMIRYVIYAIDQYDAALHRNSKT